VLRLVPPRLAVLASALVIAGIILSAIGEGTLDTVGFAVAGLGLVLAVALAFYAVGRSEDLERERAQRRR
jgi:hypothetical protein